MQFGWVAGTGAAHPLGWRPGQEEDREAQNQDQAEQNETETAEQRAAPAPTRQAQ